MTDKEKGELAMLSGALGLERSNISTCLIGTTNTCGNFKWQYCK